MTDSDLLARALASAALVLTIIQMITTSLRGRWARRSTTSAELRGTLKEMHDILAAARRPPGTRALWASTMPAKLEALLEEASEVPDRQLQAATRSVHDEVLALRGLSTRSESEILGEGIELTAAQIAHLDAACEGLRRARQRVSMARRKGGTR